MVESFSGGGAEGVVGGFVTLSVRSCARYSLLLGALNRAS